MTLVRRANHPFYAMFDSMFNDEIAKPVSRKSMPAVNVSERENEFEVEVVAPGYNKADFKIKLEKDLLTISAETKENQEQKEGEKVIRREFASSAFSRSFTLPDHIDGDQISAKYENGLLRVAIPKLEPKVEDDVKEIAIG
jgi:HSP20 family protein